MSNDKAKLNVATGLVRINRQYIYIYIYITRLFGNSEYIMICTNTYSLRTWWMVLIVKWEQAI